MQHLHMLTLRKLTTEDSFTNSMNIDLQSISSNSLRV